MQGRLQRSLQDQTLTARELKDLAQAGGATARELAATLEVHADKMTPVARDRFAAFQAEVARAPQAEGPRGRALDLLTGKVTPPVQMPSWYPANFDVKAAAVGARDILLEQGLPPGELDSPVERLVLSDADFTLIKTTTPVFLTHKVTGERLQDPATGHALELHETPGKNLAALLKETQARLPAVNVAEFAFDFSRLGSAGELLHQKPIAAAVNELKRSNRDALSRDFVVTARSGEAVAGGLKQSLGQHGASLDGVLTVNNTQQAARLGIPENLTTEGKKALAMAALLELMGPREASVRHVKFMDDTDANLVAAMTTLPRLFPRVAFEFVDVVHKGGGRFELEVVARSNKKGELVDGHGHPMSAARLESYKSQDRPWSPDA
jgi:hypothetical protein